jgi:hypothetical protein
MAYGTLFQVPLVNVATVVAYSIGYIEGKVVATLGRSHTQQLPILLFRQMFIQVEVQGTTTCQMLYVGSAV